MKKKPSKNKTTSRNVTKKQLIIVSALSSLLTLVVSLGIFGLGYQELVTREDESSISKIAFFLDEAVQNLNVKTPKASYTNKQFIQDATIEFEANDFTQLRHLYDSISDNPTIFLTSDSIVNSASLKMYTTVDLTGTLDAVPNLQNCNRMFAITFADSRPANYEDYQADGSKMLKDGRTAYFWRLSEDSCIEAENIGILEKIIRTVESY